jgi:hypothetical protein
MTVPTGMRYLVVLLATANKAGNFPYIAYENPALIHGNLRLKIQN